jgi:predicted RNase H-like nuclease (RuvC/YqgF family)
MTNPIKNKSTLPPAIVVALKQVVEDHQGRYNSLQHCRSMLVEELEAAQRELTPRIAKLDKEIMEAKASLEEAQAEYEKRLRPA